MSDPVTELASQLTRTEVMRAAQVAELLQVPASTIHEWARTGQIPSRKRGKHRLFLRSEIHRWIFDADDSDHHV